MYHNHFFSPLSTGKRQLVLVLITVVCTFAKAQLPVLDSIKVSLQGEHRAFLGFHNRNTFILSERTKLFGLVGGIDFSERVKLYAGIYGFGRADKTELIGRRDLGVDTANRFTSTTNFSLGIDYDYFKKNRLSLSVPLQIGIGNVAYEYTQVDGVTTIRTNNYRVIPVETGMNAYYELLPWVGIRAGAGYRLNVGKKEVRRLSSPYYNIGIAVLLAPLYRDIKDALGDN